MNRQKHRAIQAWAWLRSVGAFQKVPRTRLRRTRDQLGRVHGGNPWQNAWHARSRRGAPCGKLERRFFRAHPDKLFEIEREPRRGRARG